MPINHSQLAEAGDILVVDDNPENLKFLMDLLKSTGYRARPAIDGALALRSVHVRAPALILLDIKMPGMDGFEVCRRLKDDPTSRDIPIIIVTALGDTADKIKAFELGAVDFVTKPLNAEEVLMRVATHLSLALAQKQLQEQNRQLRDALDEADKATAALKAAEHQLIVYSQKLEELVAERTRELTEANAKLRELSEHDGLTGVANRRKMDTVWQDQWSRALREDSSLAVLMIDVDHFKRYNDHYGHASGDICLRQVAQTIEAKVRRSSDLVARYGGEEFVVILPCVTEADVRRIAESMRQAVEDLAIVHEHSSAAPVLTVSIGVAYWAPGRSRRSINLLTEADANLYRAKQMGRNRVL